MNIHNVALLPLIPLLLGSFALNAQPKKPTVKPEDPELYYAFFKAHTDADLKIQSSSGPAAASLSTSTAALYHITADDLPKLTAEIRKFNVNLGVWYLQSGSLPPGIALSSGGVLSGTPILAGTFPFTFEVRDAAGYSAASPLSCSLQILNPSDMITQSGPPTEDPYLPAAKVGVFRNNVSFLEDSNGNGVYDAGIDRFNPKFTGPGGFKAGDIPVTGDWNGDGQSKVGIYRQTTGQWFLDVNNNGVFDAGDLTYGFGGIASDLPVVGDWNGVPGVSTHKDCIGIFRSGFLWVLDLNCNGSFDSTPSDAVFPFGGIAGDVPVVGKWAGGRTQVGVVRKYAPGGIPQGNPFYWVLDNGKATDGPSPAAHQPGYTIAFGGLVGDLFVTGDWYGTGKSIAGVYRNGYWVLDSALPSLTQAGHLPGIEFGYGGVPGDLPVIVGSASSDPQGTAISISLDTSASNTDSATFTAKWSDPSGDPSRVTLVQIGFETPPSVAYTITKNGCGILYIVGVGMLYLGSAAGDYSFPFSSAIGSAGQKLYNGVCVIDAANTTYTLTGALAILTVPVTFVNPQTTTYVMFTSANINSNWTPLGEFTAPAAGPLITGLSLTRAQPAILPDAKMRKRTREISLQPFLITETKSAI